MTISQRFNAFLHGPILTDFYRKCGAVRFPYWVDDETGGPLIFYKGENFNSMEDLKEILKAMSICYPNDGDEKMSTTKIDSKQLSSHIEWVFWLAGENHIELDVVEREWRELLKG